MTSVMLYDVLQLRTAMEKSTAMFDKEKAQERLSKLSGGVAVFKVCQSPFWIPPQCGDDCPDIPFNHILSGWRG